MESFIVLPRGLALVLLPFAVGCSHTVTMLPRGGGESGVGTLNDGSREMVVTLKGKEYRGKFVRNQTYGFGFGQSFGTARSPLATQPGFGTTAMLGASNQATALLTSGSAVLRCELVVVNASDGSGVCVDQDNVTYDVLIK